MRTLRGIQWHLWSWRGGMYRFFVRLTFLIPAIVISQGKVSHNVFAAWCRLQMHEQESETESRLVKKRKNSEIGERSVNAQKLFHSDQHVSWAEDRALMNSSESLWNLYWLILRALLGRGNEFTSSAGAKSCGARVCWLHRADLWKLTVYFVCTGTTQVIVV